MKNAFKKFLAMIAVFSVFLSSDFHAFAAAIPDMSHNLEVTEDIIVSQALDLDSNSKLGNKNFKAVRLQSAAEEYSITTSEGNKNAIQSVSKSGNLTEVTTIIPYKQLTTGELVNSFEYINSGNQLFAILPPGTPVTENFVDVSVTVKTYYLSEYKNGVQVFRHNRFEAYWNTNKTLDVRNLKVNYVSKGDLYKYPDCYSNFSAAYVQADYRIKSYIDVLYPTENAVYGDSSHSMPSNRVLHLSNYYEHGGQIEINVLYMMNGTAKTSTTNYMVYTK